jgi:transposase
MDLRERVIQDADAGLSSKELAARYHVSRAWVDALKQRRRETGAIAPHKQSFEAGVLEGQEDRLRALVTQPDATLAELRDALRTAAAVSTVWRELNHLDLTVKKLRGAACAAPPTRRETPCAATLRPPRGEWPRTF